MAKDNSQIPEGFEEVPSGGDQSSPPAGFHPIELSDQEKSALKTFVSTSPKPSTSMLGSMAAGLSAAPTEGLSSRLGALEGVALEKGSQALGMGPQAGNQAAGLPTQSVGELYNEYLTANQKRLEDAQKANPIAYGMTQFGAGMALPWSRLAGASKLAKGAPMVEKMIEGAKAGAKIGAVTGAVNAPDYTNLPNVAGRAALGGVIGAPIGAGATGVIEGLRGGASQAAQTAEHITGPVGTRFGQGQQAAAEGIPSLATKEGLAQAKQQSLEDVKQLTSTMENILTTGIKNKPKAVADAMDKYGPLPQNKVDDFISQAQDAIQKAQRSNDQATVDELTKLLEMFTTAKEGRMINQTQRIYIPGRQPTPVSSAPQQEFDDVTQSMLPQTEDVESPTDKMLREDKTEPGVEVNPEFQRPSTEPEQKALATTDQPEEGQAEPMEPAKASPAGLAGYEKVHAATIDPSNPEEVQAFQQRLHEKIIDERAQGKNYNPADIKFDIEPIPGTNKVRAVAKRPIVNEDTGDFADQAADLKAQDKADAQRQKMLDQQAEEANKQKAQAEVEALKPPYEDVQVQTRAGDRDVYNPSDFDMLHDDLQRMAAFNKVTQAVPTKAQSLAKTFAGQASDILAQHSPEITQSNEQINAMKNIFESLGLNPQGIMQNGGKGEQAFYNELDKLYDLFKPESNTPQSIVDSIVNPEKMKYIVDQLRRIDPARAEQFSQTADKQRAVLDLIKDFQKPYAGWSVKNFVNAIRSFGGRTAYSAGYALERNKQAAAEAVKPAIQAGQRIFNNYAPEALQTAAKRIATMGDQKSQAFGQMLSKLAQADERTRNATLFVLQQQPQYQDLVKRWLPQEEQTPTARNKNVSGTTGQ